MSGGWGCPHEVNGECQRVPGQRCAPGMKGCVLHGRFLFSCDDKNSPRITRTKGQIIRPARTRKTSG